MKEYTYSEARQNLSTLLDEVETYGEIRILRRDGRTFIIRPECTNRSPLDVPAVPTNITKEEIISTIREIRERG